LISAVRTAKSTQRNVLRRPTFGNIVAAAAPRFIQLAAKFAF